MKRILFIFCIITMIFITGCKKKYEITFLNKDNTVLTVITVKDNEKISYPTPLEVEGYDFTGWSEEVEFATSDMTITATYKLKTFTVTFYDIYNKVVKEETVEYGDKATEPILDEVEGKTFIAWDKEFGNIKEDLDVMPIYDDKKYIVKYYDSEDKIISEQSIAHGKSSVVPEALEKLGYTFVGWSIDATNVTANLDIYPIFEQIYYLVTFVSFYNDIISIDKVAAYEAAIAPTVPEIPLYDFKGWDKDLSCITNNMTVKAIYEKNKDRLLINDANYWLRIIGAEYDVTKTLLTADEISNYNDKITSNYAKTKVVSVEALAQVKDADYVKSLINNYANMNSNPVYDCNTKALLTTAQKNEILNNRNLAHVPSSVTLQYGIVTDFGWLRSYPTNHYSKDYDMDRFQETSLNVGEAVAIYHESLDGNWYFVQATNYNGWIEKKNVATCSYDQMVSFMHPKQRLVITSNYMDIENVHVRMGQSFPLLETNDCHKITFPKRDSDGSLFLKVVSIDLSADSSVGYLEYTYENLFHQAFKLLKINYSWGDKDKGGRDCSSTMNAIYNCFGFMMPRNTSNQEAIPGFGQKVTNLTVNAIKQYKPGTLVFTSSHVMMYLGLSESGAPYLLHNTNANNAGCILQSYADYGPSKISAVLRFQ